MNQKNLEEVNHGIFNENKNEAAKPLNDKKSLNNRIEDLVIQIQKTNKLIKIQFSFKSIFIKGLLQGLGIIIGSTIIAGLLYSLSIKFINKDFIKENTLKYILDQENKNK